MWIAAWFRGWWQEGCLHMLSTNAMFVSIFGLVWLNTRVKNAWLLRTVWLLNATNALSPQSWLYHVLFPLQCLHYLFAKPPPIPFILVTQLWGSWNSLLPLTEGKDTSISAGPPAANDCFRNLRTPLACPQFCSALRNLVWDTAWLNEYMVIVHTNSNYPLKMSPWWQTLPSHFSRLYSKQ